jgi:Glycosyltransferase family 87
VTTKSRLFADQPYLLWGIYTLMAVLAAMSKLYLGFDENGYSHYENYRIFKQAWFHLLEKRNLYQPFPEVWDLFKYSPAFAVMMAPFAMLPDWLGLPLWNLLNALPLLAALLTMPGLTDQQRRFCAWFILPELLISLQNSQSNGLVAALILFTYKALEQQRPITAAFWAVSGGFIKIFGFFAAIPLVFHRRLWPKFTVASVLWMVVLAAGPILITGWTYLNQLYRWWYELLQMDHQQSLGLSVSGALKAWFNLSPPKMVVTLVGMAILLSAGAVSAYRKQHPLPMLAATLIWVVIFNHRAESPTFVIAMCGVALWFCALSQANIWDKTLLWATFILSSVTPTDLFPQVLRESVVQPYLLKMLPFVLVFLAIVLRRFWPKQLTAEG